MTSPITNSMETMMAKISGILEKNNPSCMLYGSLTMDDFRLGWSDIDFLCVTETEISSPDALLNLRQELTGQYSENPYFRLFEGVFLDKKNLLTNCGSNIVYWGTSGQRIINQFELDPFSRIEIIENGRLLIGNDFKGLINYPTRGQITYAIQNHYGAIRDYAHTTGESLYSAGWLLDIARCLFTLKCNKVISKTQAGEWALANDLCPNPSIMEKALQIRREPLKYKDDNDTRRWLSELNPHIQQFADVLERELKREM